MNTLLLLTVFFNFFLGLFVLAQNITSLNNRLFFLLAFLGGIWTFTNYMTTITGSIYWLDSTYALGALVIAMGTMWILTICELKHNKTFVSLIFSFSLFLFVNSFHVGFIIKSYSKISGVIVTNQIGWGLFIYTFYYLILSSIILYTLYKSYRKTHDLSKRYQYRLIFIGSSISLLVSTFTSFVLPYFVPIVFSGLDNAGFLIFLTFIAYSITRHHLFDIKIIAIEIVIFILWTILLIRLLLAHNLHDVVLHCSLLICIIIFGILLIKTVIHETKQREKINNLSNNLQKAYDHIHELQMNLEDK